MKKFIAVILFCWLVLQPFTLVLGEETNAANNEVENNVVSEEMQEEEALEEEPQIDWQEMNENQMALMMVNRHIEYLMDKVEKSEDEMEAVVSEYEERLEEEMERRKELEEEMSQKLEEKNQELEAAKDEIMSLQQRMATFQTEHGVYLQIGIGFLAGLIIGMILNAVLGFFRRRKREDM